MGSQVKDRKALYQIVGLILALAFFAYFIYPTPYEYTREYPYVKRINRFTGASETSSKGGWR